MRGHAPALIACSSIDVNKADNRGMTALHIAAQYGISPINREILTLLLQHPKIDINKTTNKGNTPLHAAVLVGAYEENIRLLLSCNGIDACKKNNNGQTALTLTGHPDIRRLLWEAMHKQDSGKYNYLKKLKLEIQ